MSGYWNNPTTKDAYRLCWISLLITFFAALFGILLYGATGSSLVLVYGLENVVDFISSSVVLWRFFAPSTVDEAVETKLQGREQRASAAISLILILLGICIVSASLADFARGQEDEAGLNSVLVLSFFSIFIFGALAMFKFRYASRLDSDSLYKDGICSFIGAVLAGALFINTLLIKAAPAIWWLDPLVALLAGVMAVIIGSHSLHTMATKEQIPVFSPSWWFTEQETSAQTNNKNINGNNNSNSELEVTDLDSDGDNKENGIV
jgi:divalent metal cation (Fe/Co/Zn/Cd) transporter